jgi:hypothetical protein
MKSQKIGGAMLAAMLVVPLTPLSGAPGQGKDQPPFLPSAQLDLLQNPMPWPGFAKFTDRDIRAIYEYLRAIPSRPPGAGFPQ